MTYLNGNGAKATSGHDGPDASPALSASVRCLECGEVIDSSEEAVVYCPFCGSQQSKGVSPEPATLNAAGAVAGDLLSEAWPVEAPIPPPNDQIQEGADFVATATAVWQEDASHLEYQQVRAPGGAPLAAHEDDVESDANSELENLVPEPHAAGLMRELMVKLSQLSTDVLRHREILRKYEQLLDGLNGEYSSLRTKLQGYVDTATNNLKARGLKSAEVPELPSTARGKLSAAPSPDAVNKQLEEAKRQLHASWNIATEIHNTGGVPSAVIYPNDPGSFFLVITGSLVAGILTGVMVSNIFNANIGTSFILGLLFYSLVYAAMMIYMHTSAISKLQNKSDRFSETARETAQQIEAFRQMATALLESNRREEISDFKGQMQSRIDELRTKWLVYMALAGVAGTDWDHDIWGRWKPVKKFSPIGSAGWFFTPQLSLAPEFEDLDMDFFLPALVPFSEGKVMLLSARGEQKQVASGAVQSALLRMLATTAPGKLRFTVIDPIGLGQSVSHLVGLAKYDESLIDGKVWSEPQHIEQRLALITEHMENVIQKYLRNEYKSIEEYNQKAKVPVPYRVLVVFDFPSNFSDSATRRLLSIARNGPRCGVYTVVVRDESLKTPYGYNPSEIEQYSMLFAYNESHQCWHWLEEPYNGFGLSLWEEPPKEIAERLVKEHGERFKDASRVSVPYSELLRDEGLDSNRWNDSTKDKIRVPLGPKDAQSFQYLTFGESGSAHHAVVIGKTGSGKSNLMHVIITTLALKYSPDEIQLYLIDFKQGVEFKEYAEYELPHARVIAIKSEREFGISVLDGLNKELTKRGDLFRDEGVSGIAAFRGKTGKPLPRLLLLVDEYQEFFSVGDNISGQASQILDRLVRQGRSYGIHVMLGSQNLSGGRDANLSPSTLNQMAIRIALQCSDSDARQILADDNPAARSLSRPGEAVYNSDNGRIEGNNFFQVAEIKDAVRDAHLAEIRELAANKGIYTKPIIFEGDQPAKLEECAPLLGVLGGAGGTARGKLMDTWIGQPVALSPPTAVRFKRQSGSHLLIVCRDEDDGVGMLTAAAVGIAAQAQTVGAQIYFADFTAADSTFQETAAGMAATFPDVIRMIGRRDINPTLKTLATETTDRIAKGDHSAKPIFLFIQGLQYARDMRIDEDDYYRKGDEGASATEMLTTLLREGPEAGIHLVMWCDTYTNATRVMNRKMMREIGMRVAGAMSNEDSQNFIEDAAASKIDKPHRAIFAQEERPGQLEKLRTYAPPEMSWLTRVARTVQGRAN